MKTWKPILIILAIVAVLVTVGILREKGLLNFKWQWLTILFAAIAAPYQVFMKWIRGNGNAVDDIRKNHEDMRQQEEAYRKVIEDRIQEREQRLALMEKDIALMDARLELLKAKKARVEKEVSAMSIDDKVQAFQDVFGK